MNNKVAPKIKICGITNPELAVSLMNLDVDYIGLVFAKSSKRYVSFKQAQSIIMALDNKLIQTVGVFLENNIDEIVATAEQLKLDFIQLYYASAQQFLPDIPKHIKKIVVHDCDSVLETRSTTNLDYINGSHDMLGIDSKKPGEGLSYDYAKTRGNYPVPMMLCGGLTMDNIQQAITAARPDVVDVSTGVESQPGVKDLDKIINFINRVNEVRVISE